MAKSDYQRIEQAITYLVAHAAEQPTLAQVAAHVHLSPFYFQRLFCQWAGTTPKRFLQVLTVERSKPLLEQAQSVQEVSHRVGLSGSSRLHDHFVQLEAMSPGEYRSKGKNVVINYGIHATPFGELFVASTQRGICRAGFVDFSPVSEQLAEVQKCWPLGQLIENPSAAGVDITGLFETTPPRQTPLPLHLTGTNFQIAVWRALLHIPEGALVSYSHLAARLGRPSAARAVGNAIGANPVAFIIPCHRVIQSSGALGGYRWGSGKKQMIQVWERMRQPPEQ
ncbi:MAG TPA: methylated-DNA--[protein]-cysteine S-methyltransferase [Marinobacter sp.]|nr:methylated-DNA--[protein]-cysteine S-methyltransferase [Marinobacter sp.]